MGAKNAFYVALLVLTVSPSNAQKFSFWAKKRGGCFKSWKLRHFSFRDDSDPAVHPLLPGWEEAMDDDGIRYYYQPGEVTDFNSSTLSYNRAEKNITRTRPVDYGDDKTALCYRSEKLERHFEKIKHSYTLEGAIKLLGAKVRIPKTSYRHGPEEDYFTFVVRGLAIATAG